MSRLDFVIISAKNFDVAILFPSLAGLEPALGSWYEAAVTSKVDENSISLLYGTVVGQMRHEVVLDVVFCRLFIQQRAYLVLRNIEVVDQPRTNAPSIINAGMKVPNTARLVIVDANDEGEDPGCHAGSSVDEEYGK